MTFSDDGVVGVIDIDSVALFVAVDKAVKKLIQFGRVVVGVTV